MVNMGKMQILDHMTPSRSYRGSNGPHVVIFTLSTLWGFSPTTLGPNVRITGSEIPKIKRVTGILPLILMLEATPTKALAMQNQTEAGDRIGKI